ncbi:hypothetical protein [Streptomyces goshikiensis]|uniref:hypothetical protein n=1 Tax=Streptomyces goshikiensis TaxID=1942 RepID=UPI0036CDC0A7
MSTPRNGGRLIAAAAILSSAGIMLLYVGMRPQDEEPATRPAPPAVRTAAPDTPAGTSPAAAVGTVPAPAGTASATPTISLTAAATPGKAPPAAAASELPHPGSGEAADPLIQEVVDKASPRDLQPADEALLLRQGRAAWMEETTRYTRVRIQAVTARRNTDGDGGPGRAVVRLVWAGADPAGTFLDGRPGSVHFTKNGDGSWKQTL